MSSDANKQEEDDEELAVVFLEMVKVVSRMSMLQAGRSAISFN